MRSGFFGPIVEMRDGALTGFESSLPSSDGHEVSAPVVLQRTYDV
jgi:hypothetical protein